MSNLDKGLPASMYDRFDHIKDMTRRERADEVSLDLSDTLESKGYEMKFMPDWVGHAIMNAQPANAQERALCIEKIMSDLNLKGEITQVSEYQTMGTARFEGFEIIIYASEDEPTNINAR